MLSSKLRGIGNLDHNTSFSYFPYQILMHLLLGPKAPSHKMGSVVFVFFSCSRSFGSTSCMVHDYVPTIYKASEPEQVATSDLECSYDL